MKLIGLYLLILFSMSCDPAEAQPVPIGWRPPLGCSVNQVIQWNGTAWVCGTVALFAGVNQYTGAAPTLDCNNDTGETFSTGSNNRRGRIVTENDNDGTTTCTLTFNGGAGEAWTTAPVCVLQLEDCGDISGTTNSVIIDTLSTTTLTFHPHAGDLDAFCIDYHCDGI